MRSLLRLKHSIDEREQMVRQREDFVSRLTHDLRTPLVAADRMLNLFKDEAFGEVSSDMVDAISIMIRSNKNLLQMVNTLLEVYRHEAGQKALIFTSIDLKPLIEEVAQELKPLAQDRGLEFRLDLDLLPPGSTVISGDRLELQRVLTNLIGNAIKFTDRGFVGIQLIDAGELSLPENPAEPGEFEIKGIEPPPPSDPKPRHYLAIEVSDSGSGISEADQETLFQRFRQGEHKRAGSGLGLYLSRRIIEAHGGKIMVESELRKGSTFRIYLPT